MPGGLGAVREGKRGTQSALWAGEPEVQRQSYPDPEVS